MFMQYHQKCALLILPVWGIKPEPSTKLPNNSSMSTYVVREAVLD